MHHLVVSLVFAFCLICSAVAEAAYVIKLKNGNEFVTGRYWHEGRQIMFDIYGGVFGIDKAFVIKIEESNTLAKPEARFLEVPADKASSGGKPEVREPKESSARSETPVEQKKDDDPILKEFHALKEKSRDLTGMLTPELIELSKNLTSLRRKIQQSGKSNNYLHEFAEIDKMGDAVEASLKVRR